MLVNLEWVYRHRVPESKVLAFFLAMFARQACDSRSLHGPVDVKLLSQNCSACAIALMNC